MYCKMITTVGLVNIHQLIAVIKRKKFFLWWGITLMVCSLNNLPMYHQYLFKVIFLVVALGLTIYFSTYKNLFRFILNYFHWGIETCFLSSSIPSSLVFVLFLLLPLYVLQIQELPVIIFTLYNFMSFREPMSIKWGGEAGKHMERELCLS